MIKFPKMHIATSVVNRIMNVADEIEADGIQSGQLMRVSAPPVAADPQTMGAQLDVALQQPPGPTPPIQAAPDPGASVDGKPLLATMLDPN